jgi:crotonobetainyl-CoA:carnitine CoA-transferase CaiB-like acyl-CoA transferase
VRVIGRPELAEDSRFLTNGDRMRNLAALVPIISERTQSRTSADWVRDFEVAGVPVGPINRIGDMLADPQVQSREMVVGVEHPRAGAMKTLGTPVKFSATPTAIRRPAPLLGEHTREVLRDLGYSAAEIEAFERGGAILST